MAAPLPLPPLLHSPHAIAGLVPSHPHYLLLHASSPRRIVPPAASKHTALRPLLLTAPTPFAAKRLAASLVGEENDPTRRSMSAYRQSLQEGRLPNNFTFPPLLKTLADSGALAEGKEVHDHVVKLGFELDAYVRNNLIRLYAVCGDMVSAQNLFDVFPDRDVVSWTSLISGYAKNRFFEEAVGVFLKMVGDQMAEVDRVAVVAVLSACSKLGKLALGKKVHRVINAKRVNLDVIAWNALVDMYAKCGDIASAYKCFKKMPQRNIISWNSMISGFVQAGEYKRALSLFRQMQSKEVEPDSATFVGILTSCANLRALHVGRWIHVYMERLGYTADGILGNALVDMYAKCGAIEQAMEMFDGMTSRDVYTYTSMIQGLAMHGRGDKALYLFSEMTKVGMKPNEVTFIGVLSACSHAGMVDEGLHHFEDMSNSYGISPRVEHYGCVVDMLGRAGLLDVAWEFIRAMPLEPDAFIWGSLLAACKMHGRVWLSKSVMKNLLEFDPEGGSYVLMSNIYSAADCRADSLWLRKAMRKAKLKKTPGCSLIEIDGVVHEFRARNQLLSRSEQPTGPVKHSGSSTSPKCLS